MNDWTKDKEKLRYDYDILPSDVVIDLGVYKGDFIDGIRKYGCTIYGYEPVPSFFDIAKKRFDSPDIKIYNYAVGGCNRLDTISVSGDASGLYGKNKSVSIKVKSIVDVWRDLGDPFVKLIKLNVEGSEYEILETAIQNNLHLQMDNIQVQWHKIGENYAQRRQDIRAELEKSHHLTYEYPYYWESWCLNV